MNQQTSSKLLIGMLVGIIVGALLGYFVPDFMLAFGIVGNLFVNALQIILLPLITSVIIVGIAGLGQTSKIGRSLIKTIAYFFGTTLVAVVIGTALVLILRPGENALSVGAFIPDMVNRARATTFTEIFSAFIPGNLIAAIVDGEYLGLTVLSLFIGGVLTGIGKPATIVIDFFKAVREISLRLVELALYAAPIGLLFLVGTAVARNPESIGAVSGNLGWLALTFLLAILVQGLVVLPLLLRIYGQRTPLEFMGRLSPALLTALGTASSAAALPVTYRNTVDDADVDERAGSLVLPLGASVNVHGNAIYLCIAAIFVAQLFSIDLNIAQIAAIAVLSVVLSIGTAGVPGTALFSLAVLFAALNYPVEAYGAIGLLVIVDWLFDRGRAVLNVWGDAVGAAIVGESFEFKTARITKAAAAASDRPSKKRERTTDRRPSRRSDSRSPSRSDSRGDSGKPRRGRGSRDSRQDRDTGRDDRPTRGKSSPRGRSSRSDEKSGPDTRKSTATRRSSDDKRDDRRNDQKSPPKRESRPMPKAPEPIKPPPKREESKPDRHDNRRSNRDSKPSGDRPTSKPPEPSPAAETVAEERGRLAAQLAYQRHGSLMDSVEAEREEPRDEKTASKPHDEKETPVKRRPLDTEQEETRDSSRPKEDKPEPEAKEPSSNKSAASSQRPEPKPAKPSVSEMADTLDRTPPEKPPEEHRQEKEPQPQSKPEPKPEKQQEEDSKEKERALSFGRSRSRKGPPPSSKSESSSKDADEKLKEDTFKVDEIKNFGRGRKKRTR